MNRYIEEIETIRFSLWDGLHISITQAVLLLIFTTGISYWLMEKQKKGLITGLVALLSFFPCAPIHSQKVRGNKKLLSTMYLKKGRLILLMEETITSPATLTCWQMILPGIFT